ncbi:MAG: GNAT family N-acetyltransferase [Deltaproteobacteria bacterium]|jgi:GNAT superfamily N-acetyltransferase|nr:GNAT family N-acetyltransferase [Deltaproteobacteria bacterium]
MELRPIDPTPSGLETLRGLLASSFPEATHLDVPYLRWSYVENPVGLVVGFNAQDDARLAAHYATLPVVARVAGREARGLLSLHTATHADYRGRGLFPQLAEATYRAGADGGFEFVVGVANAASTPGFVRRLGFQLVRPLDVRLGFGAAPAPGAATHLDFERVWDEPALGWRLRCPARDYRRAEDARGATLYAPTDRLGIWVELGRAIEGSSIQSLRPFRGLQPLRLWMGLDPARDWAHSSYFSLPMRLRPSPLNLIFRDLTGAGRRLDADRVRFAALDFDAY